MSAEGETDELAHHSGPAEPGSPSMRPGYVPYAIAATGLLAVNALLLQADALAFLRVVLPIAALTLLAVEAYRWGRG